MTGRTNMTQGGSTGIVTSTSDNQPMDLAQKSQTARITDAVTNVVKGGAAFVHFGSTQLIASSTPTHVVTCKPGLRNEGPVSGSSGGVTLFPRQTSQGALNLVTPNSGPSPISSFTSNVTVAARSVSHSTSASVTIATTSSLPTSGYHIPRGAAAVANMTASRSQTLSSIARTSSQLVGTPSSTTITSPRTNIISQRMVPISNSNWIRNSATAVLSTKVSTPGTGRGTVTSGRSSQSPGMSITTYHGGTVKPGTIVTGTIRSQGPGTTRLGSTNEAQRVPHTTAKGIHITHPVSSSQKYISGNTAGCVRGVGTSTFISPGSVIGTSIGNNTIYTPTSTLVTSLASSGTTITPHPANRSQPPNTVRLTSAVTSVFSQPSSSLASSNSLGGGICLTPSSSATILTHHPNTLTRSGGDQMPLKTPLVRTTHQATSQSHAAIKANASGLPAATHISFSSPKVIAQSTPAPLTQLSTVAGPKSPVGPVLATQAGTNSTPFQPRIGRGGGATISMTKVIPQVKGMPTHGLTPSLSTVTATPVHPAHPTHNAGSNPNGDTQSPHTSVFLQRSTHPAITVGTGVTTAQSDRNVATVTQYSIATPYYFDANNQTFPINASIVPANHYIPSSGTSGTVKVGGNGVTNSVGTNTTETNNHQGVSMPIIKPNASPRPSILRKRPEIESGAPLKASKNLSAALNIPMTSPPSPARPDSRGNGNISSGSTTLSANSSPGTEEDTTVSSLKVTSSSKQETSGEEKQQGPCIINFPQGSMTPSGVPTLIETPVVVNTGGPPDKANPQGHQNSPSYGLPSSQGMDGVSPRKKPRKQQLMGNELHEIRSVEEDFEHPVLKKIKKETPCPKSSPPQLESDEEEKDSWTNNPSPTPASTTAKADSWRESSPSSESPEPVLKRPHMSLINSYRQTWKARHNHFSRHSDVRPKEERRRTVNEIANQKMAMQRVNGWKVMHLSGQVEDLVEMESDVVGRLQVLLNAIEKRQQLRKSYKDFDKDVNRLSELVKANMQRSIIIKDQMAEAKTQMSKIFNHKDNIVSILTKYENKRSLRKKDKL